MPHSKFILHFTAEKNTIERKRRKKRGKKARVLGKKKKRFLLYELKWLGFILMVERRVKK